MTPGTLLVVVDGGYGIVAGTTADRIGFPLHVEGWLCVDYTRQGSTIWPGKQRTFVADGQVHDTRSEDGRTLLETTDGRVLLAIRHYNSPHELDQEAQRVEARRLAGLP